MHMNFLKIMFIYPIATFGLFSSCSFWWLKQEKGKEKIYERRGKDKTIVVRRWGGEGERFLIKERVTQKEKWLYNKDFMLTFISNFT